MICPSFCLFLCLYINFRASSLVVLALIIPFDIFKRHLEHLTLIIVLPFPCVTGSHHFEFLCLCLRLRSIYALSLGSDLVRNNVFFWLMAPQLTTPVSLLNHLVTLYNVVLHLVGKLLNIITNLFRARLDFRLLRLFH